MTLKNPKPSQTNKNLLKNFDLGEELKDKNGEKITGGATFRFENRTENEIVLTLLNGSSTTIRLEAFVPTPTIQTPTIKEETISSNLITFEFDEIPSLEDFSVVRKRMTPNRKGIFELDETNRIVFTLE